MSNIDKNKFIATIKTIHANIDQPISLCDLADSVGISVSTLKRMYQEATHQSVGSFIRRLRMEQAFKSLKSNEDTILETALSAGFEDHSAFARAFKRTFGYSPSNAREKLNIVNELESVTLEEPEFIKTSTFHIQSVTEQGLYFEAAPKAWATLNAHLDKTELEDDFSGMYIGIGHDNPHDGEVSHDQVRFSAGIAFLEKDLNIDRMSIAQSTYAKFKYNGKLNNLGMAYHYIYGAWLEKSAIKIASSIPAFMVFDHFPDGLKEQLVAIYVPLVTNNNEYSTKSSK